MGTSCSYLFLKNDSLGIAQIKGMLEAIDDMPKESLFCAQNEMAIQALNAIGHNSGLIKFSPATVAYSNKAEWLGFYKEALCNSEILYSKDALCISKMLGVPIMTFALLDSDVLYNSYADAAKGEQYDHISLNSGYEVNCLDGEFDDSCSHFLEDLAGTNVSLLHEIWNSDKYALADDRLRDICKITGLALVGGETGPLDDFQLIRND